MTRSSDQKNRLSISQFAALKHRRGESSERASSTNAVQQEMAYPGMKLTPWGDVWKFLKTARFRGHGEMIEVFYDTLFKEAIFDDRGAWSLERRQLH